MTIEITALGAVIIASVFLFCVALSVWGLLDIYAMMRFRKNKGIDQTAILGNWINLKWMFASRVKEMTAKHPWLGQDLSEVLGEKPDDGNVS